MIFSKRLLNEKKSSHILISHKIEESTQNYDEPIIHLADNILKQAIELNASDIHIEHHDKICRIRYRQHGILQEVTTLQPDITLQLISRLKIIANLDISEKRIPQDGRYSFHHYDIRISTCPTIFGEKVVLRILNPSRNLLTFDELGFIENQKEIFLHAINQPQGLILVTGPTGSGKTLTLYTALNYLNRVEKNISTIEDPIEIQLNGINQTQINPKIDLNFSTILRTLLRQDPDILMIGEIRDRDTAELAIQASHTGHLILSTLHTNNAIETITRLKTIPIPSYQLANAISLIAAQRLIRRLCSNCKIPIITPHSQLAFLELPLKEKNITIFQAAGCETCLQGYIGRTAIYELLPIYHNMNNIITSKNYTKKLSDYFLKNNFISLKQAAFTKLINGETSLNEVKRVLFT